MIVAVPAVLTSIVVQWRDVGAGAQPAAQWNRRTWVGGFPEQHEFLEGLPDGIDREVATGHAARISDAATAVQAFIVAMIWGYGRVGYGAYRARRVLTENEDSGGRLAEVADVARQKKDLLAAFEHLSQHPLTHLGVAFGTKYLYFCSAAVRESHAGQTAIAPVLDAVVRQWLTAHTELRRSRNASRSG